MSRRVVACIRLIALLLTAGLTEAQHHGKVAEIGVLSPGYSGGDLKLFDPFRLGLRDLGYVEGQGVVIDERYADGHPIVCRRWRAS